jgi:hypothetical protein
VSKLTRYSAEALFEPINPFEIIRQPSTGYKREPGRSRFGD